MDAKFNRACQDQIWTLLRNLKDAFQKRFPPTSGLPPNVQHIVDKLAPVWASYHDFIEESNKGKRKAGQKKSADGKQPEDGKSSNTKGICDHDFNTAFAMDNIFYDAKANPRRHVKAFYLLCRILEKEGAKSMQCFPLRRSWVHAHMHIDTLILRQHILDKDQSKSKDEPKDELEDELEDEPKDKSKVKPKDELKVKWGQVLDMKRGPFKEPKRPKPGDRVFQGSVKTDGVAISITVTLH
ncbi:hypothetical protein GGI15_004188 [Coemansia interrupta]|uniref:Uncharacterized protein n=1 Tax=Coemansia interrupta TaxID=1126814 RepID=A0A9W8LFI0_9FUNG|nr:hypothetical protein GGI15_004188 [Coemansia interrupta]